MEHFTLKCDLCGNEINGTIFTIDNQYLRVCKSCFEQIEEQGKKYKDVYQKYYLLSGSDKEGVFWEIRNRDPKEVLRKDDLIEIANWISLEIKK